MSISISEKDASVLFAAEKLRRDLGSATVESLLNASISPEDLEKLHRADEIQRNLGGPEAVSNLLDAYRSKRSCPECGAHKLLITDEASVSNTVYYHCLSCNNHFSEHSRLLNSKQPSSTVLPEVSNKFWDKADRVAVTTAGGAAIGGSIAQVPGALVGALIGASYGWYVSFSRKNSSETS